MGIFHVTSSLAEPTTKPSISLRNYSTHNFKVPFCQVTTWAPLILPLNNQTMGHITTQDKKISLHITS